MSLRSGAAASAELTTRCQIELSRGSCIPARSYSQAARRLSRPAPQASSGPPAAPAIEQSHDAGVRRLRDEPRIALLARTPEEAHGCPESLPNGRRPVRHGRYERRGNSGGRRRTTAGTGCPAIAISPVDPKARTAMLDDAAGQSGTHYAGQRRRHEVIDFAMWGRIIRPQV